MDEPRIPKGLNPTSSMTGGALGGVLDTEVEGGMPRSGMEWDRGPREFQVQMILDSQRMGIWTVFLLRVIQKGSIFFWMPIDSGMGKADHLVKLNAGTYATSKMGGDLTSVTFSVLATPNAYDYSEADAAALIDLWNEVDDDLGALLARIAQTALVDTTVLDF